MNEEQNEVIVRRFNEEMWNRRKFDVADELIAPNCQTHQLCSQEDAVGRPRSPELVKREAAIWLSGFLIYSSSWSRSLSPAIKSLAVAQCVARIAAFGWE